MQLRPNLWPSNQVTMWYTHLACTVEITKNAVRSVKDLLISREAALKRPRPRGFGGMTEGIIDMCLLKMGEYLLLLEEKI